MIYYIYLDGKQIGPLCLEEVLEKRLSKVARVWREDQTEWKMLADFNELAPEQPKLPPPLHPTPPAFNITPPDLKLDFPTKEDKTVSSKTPPPLNQRTEILFKETIMFERNKNFFIRGIVCLIIGLPLMLFFTQGGILVLFGIIQMSYTKYPLVFEAELLKYKTAPLASVKRINYANITSIEHFPKKTKLLHTAGRTTIYRHNFNIDDWEAINNCIKKFK